MAKKAAVKLFDTTLGKTVKAALYIGMSAAISYVITLLTKKPDLMGVYYPVVNVSLVALKNFFDGQVKNLPDSYKLR